MELSPEDGKLITLARSSRARTSAKHGAAVRDLDGRTYAASTVKLGALQIDALDLAVAMAVSSGAKGLEAAAVVTDLVPEPLVNASAVRELAGHGISVIIADPAGQVGMVRTT